MEVRMDAEPVRLRRHLEQVERHIAEGTLRIDRQRTAARLASELLGQMEVAHRRRLRMREWLLKIVTAKTPP
jgi:hypothetical protein